MSLQRPGRTLLLPSCSTNQPRARASRVVSRRPKRQRPENQLVFRVEQKISTTAAPSPSSTLSSATDGRTLCDQHIAQWTAKKKRTLTPGYLGLAFPEDIFSEYEDSLRVEDPDHAPAAATTTYLLGDSDQVQLGVQVLLLLKKIRWFHEIIELKNKISPGWFLGSPLTRNLCTSIEEM